MNNRLISTTLVIQIMVAASLFGIQPASLASIIPPIVTLPGNAGNIGNENGVAYAYSVPENIPSFNINGITLTNSNYYSVIIMGNNVSVASQYGDSTDNVTGVAFTGGTCTLGGVFIANGTCTMNLKLNLPNELDYGDFGISTIKIVTGYYDIVNSNSNASATLSFGVKVNDVPEIDASSAMYALYLLIGSLCIWNERRRSPSQQD